MEIFEIIGARMGPYYQAMTVPHPLRPAISMVISAVLLLVITVVVSKVLHRIVTGVVYRAGQRPKTDLGNIMLTSGVFRRTDRILPPILIYFLFPLFVPLDTTLTHILRRVIMVYILVVFARLFSSIMDSANTIYQNVYEDSARRRPIKAYLQTAKVSIYVLIGMLIITTLANVSPVGVISGLGAMSAVFMLVFKDPIMGVAASAMLSANDMVRIGDWISMPKYDADGAVTDITMQSIAVQNWDKSVTTIPVYALISDSFMNWRGIFDVNLRRLRRAIHIDITSVRFLTPEETVSLNARGFLRPPVTPAAGETTPISNTEAFRAYLTAYLEASPMVDLNQQHIVRYLPSDVLGLVMEFTVFVKTADFVVFEGVHSQVVEHILGALPEFGLRPFQARCLGKHVYP
jgi:miniconductance mechanosensitive channel